MMMMMIKVVHGPGSMYLGPRNSFS